MEFQNQDMEADEKKFIFYHRRKKSRKKNGDVAGYCGFIQGCNY